MAGTKTESPVESLDWLYHMHFVRSEFAECEKQIQRSVHKSDYGHYLRSLIRLREDGDAVAALTHLQHVQQKDNSAVLKTGIRCLVLSGRHAQVVDGMRERGLVACPADWQVWLLIGLSFRHMGNVSRARDAFQRATQCTSTQAQPFLLLAQSHVVDNDTKSAIFVLRKACELLPDDARLTERLAVLLLSSGKLSKGQEKMMQLQHVSTNVIGNLSLSLAVGSVLQQARQDVDGALYRYKLANTSESAALWNNVALCFASRSKVVAGISCLKRAHYLNQFDWRITFNLGMMHMQMRQFASAFHFLMSSAAMSDGAPHVVSLLATTLECLQDEVNAMHAHATAAKSAVTLSSPAPLLNFAVFLCRLDMEQHRDQIVRLMMDFEKCWVDRRQSGGDFDLQTMRLATKIANVMQVAHHMAWIRVRSPVIQHVVPAAANPQDRDPANDSPDE